MFMRFLKPKAPAPQPVLPAREDTLAYFTPEQPRHAPRDLSVLDQMFGYYSED